MNRPADLRGNKEGRDALSALLALIDVGVEVDIWYVAVENGTSRLDHAIGELWAHANCMSAERILKYVNTEKNER